MHPELPPTRLRDLPVGSWGVVFSVGGATLVSLLGTILPFYLTVINYKIFGKLVRIVLDALLTLLLSPMVPGTKWGTRLITLSGGRHPELPPTRRSPRDLPVGSSGVVSLVGGATLVLLLGNHYVISPHRNKL